jgi:hypothetical protein
VITKEEGERQSSMDQSWRHRLLPRAGIGVAVVAFLAHFLGGGALMHLGLPALLVTLGVNATPLNLGPGVLLVALAAVIVIKLLLIISVTRTAGGRRLLARVSETHGDITGKGRSS